MAELFRVDKSGISRHLKNIFATGELSRNSVDVNFATTASDGKSYQVEHYCQDEPTGVEKDFVEAEKKIKHIDHDRKKKGN